GCVSVFPTPKSGWRMFPWAIFIASGDMACEVSHDCRNRPEARTADPTDDPRLSRAPARDRSGSRFGLHRLAHIAPHSDSCPQPELAILRPWYLSGWQRQLVRCLSSEGGVGRPYSLRFRGRIRCDAVGRNGPEKRL